MSSKLLQGIGVLAIVGLAAGSIAALVVVKERIHVTLAAEEAASKRGPDPIELLRADVGTLGGDVAALNRNLETAVAELRRSLDALQTRLAALQPAAKQDGAAAPAPTPAQPAPASPPKKSFLAFDLPSSAFTFDRRQRFAIVPSLSRVGFDAKSTLHDFSGVSSSVEGTFNVDLSRPGEKPSGRITVEAASLDTGLADRDVDMRKTLAVEQFQTLTFEWNGFVATGVDARAMTVAGTASGKLTIRGRSRDVSLPVKVSVDASRRVAIEGELAIKLGDFEVVPPSQLGVIKVADEMKLWIALRARLLGPAKEGE
jgi:polyisoprenoid-binding protein YceI